MEIQTAGMVNIYKAPALEVIAVTIERGYDTSYGEEGEAGAQYDSIFLGDF